MNSPGVGDAEGTRPLPRLNPFDPPRWLYRLSVAGFAVMALYLGVIGASRIYLRWPDYEYFYKAGSTLLREGTLDPGWDWFAPPPADASPERLAKPFGHVRRGTLDWYWPFVPRMMTLLTWMPYKTAGFVWLTMNLGAMFLTLWLIGKYLLGMPARNWPVSLLLPFLFMLVFWYWEFRLNQIDNITLLLLVGSFVAWQSGRSGVAGGLLGWAVLLKITPMLVVVWFAMKRQFRTVAVALATVVLAGPVSDTIIFGPERVKDIYTGWLHAAVSETSHRGLILAQKEMDWRNQALGAVLSRWLHPTNYNTHFDNEPRAPWDYAPDTHNVVDLPLTAVAGIALAIAAVSGLALLWIARRPATALNVWQLRLEWALFVLAMLWFMPVMRLYHMIWAFPAMALAMAAIWHVRDGRRWQWMVVSCIAVVIVGEAVLPWRELKSMGGTLLSVLCLAIPIVALLRRLAREPDAMAPDRFTPGHPLRRSIAAETVTAVGPAPVVAHA